MNKKIENEMEDELSSEYDFVQMEASMLRGIVRGQT